MRAQILNILQNDSKLANVIDNVGEFTLKPNKSPFSVLVKAIINQQLSIIVADKIYTKLQKNMKGITPKKVLLTDYKIIRKSGVSDTKTRCIIDLADYFIKNRCTFSKFNKMSNEEIIESLTQIRGVGIWTVNMFLIFSLMRLDVLPESDMGLRTSIMKSYRLKKPPTEKRVRQIGKKWSPYSTIAVWYLWKNLNKNGR